MWLHYCALTWATNNLYNIWLKRKNHIKPASSLSEIQGLNSGCKVNKFDYSKFTGLQRGQMEIYSAKANKLQDITAGGSGPKYSSNQ